MTTQPRRVRDRIYLRLPAEVAREQLRREMSPPFGRLAGSNIWHSYRVAPTADGCVIEIVDHEFPQAVRLIRRWLLPAMAVLLAGTYLTAAMLGLTNDFTLLGLAVFLLVFEAMILAQPLVATPMYGQYLRARFAEHLSGPSDQNGAPIIVRR